MSYDWGRPLFFSCLKQLKTVGNISFENEGLLFNAVVFMLRNTSYFIMKKNTGYVNSGYDMKKRIWKIDFNVVEFKEKKRKEN